METNRTFSVEDSSNDGRECDCEIMNIEHQFRVEFVFNNRLAMDRFINQLEKWTKNDADRKKKLEFNKRVKKFQTNLDLPNFRTAKTLYLDHLKRIQNVRNDKNTTIID
jgi:hypothetical protein